MKFIANMDALSLLLMTMVAMVASNQTTITPAARQLIDYAAAHKVPNIMTTSAGSPIEYHDATNTLNSPLIYNKYFMDTMTHLVRERIPERVAHAKGAGAFGDFVVTHDISQICKASLFSEVGKVTPIAVRFSTAAGEKGSSDTARDVRGTAIKFYTEEGNFDLLGISSPAFLIRDPIKFSSLLKSLMRNPTTNLRDANIAWDFITNNPESLYAYLLVFSDLGIPDGFRHTPSYSIHTYQVVNKHGDIHFVRFHITPDAGIKNLNSEQVSTLASDPDFATRDLYNNIAEGNCPSWTLSVQISNPEDARLQKEAGLDIFDVTKVLPLEKYPLFPVGKLILNRNPNNYFADVEQLAFSPGNLVPGILGSPDKLFEARVLAYRDAHNYRLGVNHDNIPVNCPMRNRAFTYNRDGVPPVLDNGGDSPNYFPNSFNGPVPYLDVNRREFVQNYEEKPNNFEQASAFYNGLTADEQDRLVSNLLGTLKPTIPELQEKAVKYINIIDSGLGYRVQQGLLSA